MSATKSITILGIDPGTQITGYGLITSNVYHAELLLIGSIYTEKYDDHYDKLCRIYDDVLEIITIYKPDVLAIEAPFYAKNVQSMLKLGRAQGMAIAAALSKKIPIFEYAPKRIKQSITGNGNAAKEQVAAMLCQLLKTDALPKQLDATDGLATAMCHHFSLSTHSQQTRKHTSWNSFLKDNPKRIK